MRRFLSAFKTSADPVVAVHDTESAVEAAVAVLGHAGYHSRMLTIVGGRCPPRLTAVGMGSTKYLAWRRSSLFWGVSWTLLMSAVALAWPAAAATPGPLLMLVSLGLIFQTLGVARAVAPERTVSAGWRPSSAGCQGYEDELAADKLLLVVNGSLSEVALARSLLSGER